ncbi:MAG: glycosyltransferase family 4 protein [Euryarchaeota archaeon]|nr:glycosyltransferase family 4 protein [Euryarchaeota archaeon]
MEIGLVVYGGLDETSGGFRYNRRLVDYLRSHGDTVEVIALPWRNYWRGVVDGLRSSVSTRLNRPVDVLLQDELCHPSLWRQNHRLTRPGAVVALVHHVGSDDHHGRLSRLRRWIERRYLDSVDGTVCTSEFTRRRAAALGGGLGESLVAPPAGRVEGRGLSETAVRQRAADGPLRIAFVGNLLPRKGLTTLLSAVSTLARRHDCSDWRMTVVGSEADPEYAATAVDRAVELGVDDRIEFTGEIADSELTDVFEASHVLCVPSRYEGFGMVYLEAMEYGVVPIASARGGAGEFIRDGDNGFLVDPGDEGRIAALLADLAADRARLADLGVAALDTAAAHPSWDETLAAVRSLLTRMATDRSSSADRAASPNDTQTEQGGRP